MLVKEMTKSKESILLRAWNNWGSAVPFDLSKANFQMRKQLTNVRRQQKAFLGITTSSSF